MKTHDIMTAIESRKDEIVKLVQNLIQIKSVNPPGDTSDVSKFIKEYTSKYGLKCDLYEPENSKVNAVATLSGSGSKKFVWNGHIDVVPASKNDGWTVDPWEGKVVNSKIMGRGAADMKGSIGAAISAACILAESGMKLSGDWILGFTADEETGGAMGAEYMVNNEILTGDACIVGEGTSPNKLCIGEKGVLWLKVKAKGRPVHASMAFFGDNAIEKLFKFTTKLHEIEKVERKYNAELEKIISIIKTDAQKSNNFSDEIFQKLAKRLVMNVGMIKGGEKINIVPASAEAIIDIRILPGMRHKTVMDETRQILVNSGLDGITFETVLKANSSYQPLENSFVEFMKEEVIKEMNMEPGIFLNPGFTDARFFRAMGIPTVIYGCDGQNHHGVDEFITIDNLVSTTKAYALAAIKFLQ